MKTLFALLMAAAGLAQAQNSDLALLGGLTGPTGQTSVSNGTTTASGSVSPSLQLNYAWQVRKSKTDLYVEGPLEIVMRESGSVTNGPGGTSVSGSAGPDLFFTPGVRVKFSPEARVSFYGAAGAGVASFTGAVFVSPSSVESSTGRRNSYAIGFGGGIDFRLTRLLSLRGDVRDFITESGLGGATGRNHAIGQFGLAFHF